jgi:hypothetical protein
MGRHWSHREYVSSEWLWNWLDQQRQRIDSLLEDDKVQSCEIYKMTLLSKLEALEAVGSFVAEEEETLGTILTILGVSTIKDTEVS